MNSSMYSRKRLTVWLFVWLCAGFFLVSAPEALPQLPQGPSPFEMRDLSTIRSVNISDSQLRRFVDQGRAQGMTVYETMQLARQRGLPASEAETLIRRIRDLEREAQKMESDEREKLAEPEMPDQDTIVKPDDELDEIGRRIFGARLFRQEGLTFEPSMNIPTPVNYQLGPGDEIIVDIWGAATNVHHLEVSNQGTVTIENLAPIYVHGLSMEEATGRIIESLGTIYRGLRPGSPSQTTFARVHLGQLRSIQVTVMGEVHAPGNYTLSSLSTVFNALFNSRGPNNIGSYRNVKVIRGNEVAAELDVYDLLIHGNQKNNIRLHDQDIIMVIPYETRVDIRGRVKRDGLYEMKDDESMADLIRYAGNFADSAYTRNVRVHRYTPSGRRIMTVRQEDYPSFELRNGDAVFVDQVLERFENRVSISGAVWRPGEFELKENMGVYDLILEADGLRPDAYRSRAIINRIKDNFDFDLLSVDLDRVMDDPGTYNIPLRPEDEILIQTLFDMREEYSVIVEGAVRDPGEYPFRDNMTLEDIILKAKGFMESATEARIEVFRRITGDPAPVRRGNRLAETYVFEVSRNLSMREADKQFKLKPFDQVYVRNKPDYHVQQNVIIEGEVMYPGTYTLANRNERISDIIRRAGGLTPEAYPEGATLVRDIGQLQRVEVEILGSFGEIIDTIPREENYVGINLPGILARPGSSEDIFLREGDVIRIPLELQTVKVSGSVLREVEIRHRDGRGLKYYVNRSGGFSDDAIKRRAYVVYANGDVQARKNFLFINSNPDINPGAEIIIPQKPYRERMDTREFVSVMASIASTAAVIVTIITRL
jgi:protein involved in polysaccharide export with SLBB domain